MTWNNFFLVGIGGFLGSLLRYSTYLLIKPTNYPVATFIVNLAGSFLIGLIMALSVRYTDLKPEWRLFIATGFCGGFTTFSAFTLENLHFLKTGQYAACITYVAGSILFGIFAAWLGFSVIR